MAELIIAEKSELVNIADAIRAKTDTTDTLALSEMPQMIADIETGKDVSGVTAIPSDVLSPKVFVDSEGVEQIGTIPTRISSELTASGATVSVPAGYYASTASKSVATATRANTTITTTVDDTNDKITITASNNQATGYVTGSNKTASTTISLSASGASVTASDGTNKVSKSVATATQATPSITIDSAGLITASATQTAGYVPASTKSATKQLTVQVVGGTSQPSSPAANTIWVNTSTAITSWVFSTTQPASPVAGMVWFQTSITATAAFNALKNNNITVYPGSCRQYVSGAWVSKTAKTYQGGAWKNWELALYSNGVYGADFIFGGTWSTTNMISGSNADYVELENTVGYQKTAYWRANKLIDFSGWNTVTISHAGIKTAYEKDYTQGVLQVVNSSGTVLASKTLAHAAAAETVSLDISNVTGNGYVQIGVAFVDEYSGSAYFKFKMSELVVK